MKCILGYKQANSKQYWVSGTDYLISIVYQKPRLGSDFAIQYPLATIKLSATYSLLSDG